MTADLPPPGGAPYPPPGTTPPGTTPPEAVQPAPTAPPYAFPAPPGHPGFASASADPLTMRPRIPMPGTNGLAIAALCCGIAGLVPLASVAAIVLGIVALNQLRDRIQRGKGLAVAGLVLGALWLVAWVVFVVAVAGDLAASPVSGTAPSRSPASVATSQSETFVDDLEPGDCFSGGMKDGADLVTVVPCSSPHESQVVTVFELPSGPYPGERKVIKAADEGCTDKGDPLITDQAYEDLDLSYFYPDDYAWRGDRHVICLVEAPSGTTTGSALK